MNENRIFRGWQKTLVYLYMPTNENVIIQTIANSLNIAYPHLTQILKFLHREKLVTSKKIGRIRKIKLTKDGNEIARDLTKVFDRMKISCLSEKEKNAWS